jgi:hypothetical protein
MVLEAGRSKSGQLYLVRALCCVSSQQKRKGKQGMQKREYMGQSCFIVTHSCSNKSCPIKVTTHAFIHSWGLHFNDPNTPTELHFPILPRWGIKVLKHKPLGWHTQNIARFFFFLFVNVRHFTQIHDDSWLYFFLFLKINQWTKV